jgi:hypothetical protein
MRPAQPTIVSHRNSLAAFESAVSIDQPIDGAARDKRSGPGQGGAAPAAAAVAAAACWGEIVNQEGWTRERNVYRSCNSRVVYDILRHVVVFELYG